MMLTVYGDESGTHDESPIMMLAGYVARLGQINTFDTKWNRAIERAGLPWYFHATEHFDTKKGALFCPLALKMIEKHFLFGYVVELDKESYDRYYIADRRPKKPQLGTCYSLCFRFLMSMLLTHVPLLLGRDDLNISFLLEEGAAGSKDSQKVVQLLRKEPTLETLARIVGEVSFGQKKKFPGLQASDYLSYCALNLAPSTPSMIALPEGVSLAESKKASQTKRPVYHCRLDEGVLGELKTTILALVKTRKLIAEQANAARD
jgi:hypothetical protein